MDLLDVSILALRMALVAILYVFLLLVLRLAARGLQSAPPPPSAVLPPEGLELAVLAAGTARLTPGQLIQVVDGAALGRSARAAVVLADETVSAEHARLRRVGRSWVVSDLGSTNGTWVNDARVEGEMPLLQGDVLALGNVRLKVSAR